MKNDSMKLIALDLGGSKIVSAIITSSGIFQKENKILTNEMAINEIINCIIRIITTYNSTEKNIVGIGLSTPGIVDKFGTIIGAAPNIKGWIGTPIKRILQSKFDKEIIVRNDSELATLGQKVFGSDKILNNFACISIGTGLNAGIVKDGLILDFPHELGHTIAKFDGATCECGNIGCFEAYCSGTGLIRNFNRIDGKSKNKSDEITVKEIFELYRLNKSNAKKAVKEFIIALSCFISNIVLSYSINHFRFYNQKKGYGVTGSVTLV